jgi:hypothetical protein
MDSIVTALDPRRSRVIYLSPAEGDTEARFALFLDPGGRLRLQRLRECDEPARWQTVLRALGQLASLAAQSRKPRLRASLESAARAILEHVGDQLAGCTGGACGNASA